MTGDYQEFWEMHDLDRHLICNKNSSSRFSGTNFVLFQDLFLKMVNPSVEDRLTIGEIKSHEWYTASTIEKEEMSDCMMFRLKARGDTADLSTNKVFPFHHFKIPNDDDIVRPKRLSKGLKFKKYSGNFMFETGKTLISAIIAFAELQGLCYTEDSAHLGVVLESQTDDVNLSVKANIVDNPESDSQCIECIKLSGDKTPFMKLFHQLCQHCMTADENRKE